MGTMTSKGHTIMGVEDAILTEMRNIRDEMTVFKSEILSNGNEENDNEQ